VRAGYSVLRTSSGRRGDRRACAPAECKTLVTLFSHTFAAVRAQFSTAFPPRWWKREMPKSGTRPNRFRSIRADFAHFFGAIPIARLIFSTGAGGERLLLIPLISSATNCDNLSPTLDPSSFDRRSRFRQADPPCPTCTTSAMMRATLRTPHVIYFRCQVCGEVLSLDKPVQRLPITEVDRPRARHPDEC
jgi:hypothetical protein